MSECRLAVEAAYFGAQQDGVVSAQEEIDRLKEIINETNDLNAADELVKAVREIDRLKLELEEANAWSLKAVEEKCIVKLPKKTTLLPHAKFVGIQ